MRKLLYLLLVLLYISGNAQDIKLEQTHDILMSKKELFSKTRMFISDKWENPKRSILNEDMDNGIIQVKTEKEFSINVGMGLKCIYKYEYLTKFRFKDNKYKVEIYDIVCISALQVGLGSEKKIPLIPYFTNENVPQTKKAGKGISKKKAIEMMEELNGEFNEILNQYNKYLSEKDDF